jgi:hypothetical protein
VIRRVVAANGFGRHAERLTSAHRSSARAHRARRGRRRRSRQKTHSRASPFGRALSLYVRDYGLDPRPGVAALRQVAGHGERGVSLVARGEDVCDDVRDGERRELGDWPVEQPCVPLAPLAEQIVVGHRSLD